MQTHSKSSRNINIFMALLFLMIPNAGIKAPVCGSKS